MEEDFKYLGTRGRGGLRESGSESGPGFQKTELMIRKENLKARVKKRNTL